MEKKEDLPHVIIIVNELLLVTCTGKKLLCLRCRQVRHYRRECVTSYCRHHGTYHSTEECSTATSYAGALKGQDKDEPEAVDETEVEEEVSAEKTSEGDTNVSETGNDTAVGRKGMADNDVSCS